MTAREQVVAFIQRALQQLVAESFETEIPALNNWFIKVKSDEGNQHLDVLSCGEWSVVLAAMDIKVKDLPRYLGFLGHLHDAKQMISEELQSQGIAKEEIEELLEADWIFAHVLHKCLPSSEAIEAAYADKEEKALSLILQGRTGVLLIPQACDDETTRKLCTMIADGEFEDCSHNFGDLCENRTEEQVKAATDREYIVDLAIGLAEMSPKEIAHWVKVRHVHLSEQIRTAQALNLLTEASPGDTNEARLKALRDWVPPELVGADIQQTLANLANAAAQVPDAAHQLNIDNDELEAAAELGAGA